MRFVKEPSIKELPKSHTKGTERFDKHFFDRSITPPEYKNFVNSNKRDVYSFGVFLWEIFSLVEGKSFETC